jgi:hypothetical protein
MIWDFCPDMMHIIKTFFERLVLGVFSGSRKPNYTNPEPAKLARNPSRAEQKEHQEKMRKHKAKAAAYEKEIKAFDECYFDEDARKLVDTRVQNLVGYPYWIRSSLVSHASPYTLS